MGLKLAVCALLVCAGMQLPSAVHAQTDKAARSRAAVKPEQPAEAAVSTGDSAIDLLISSQAESAASSPAVETVKARRIARAGSAAEVTDQSFRDALLHEAALTVANQTRADDTPPQVVQVPSSSEETSESKPRSQQGTAEEGMNDSAWSSTVRSAVATLRENRNWLVMGALLLGALAIAASLARGGSFKSAGERRAGPDRRGGADRRFEKDFSGQDRRGVLSSNASGAMPRRSSSRRADSA